LVKVLCEGGLVAGQRAFAAALASRVELYASPSSPCWRGPGRLCRP